jgi:iron complex transport system ATP-binding protein
MTALLSLKEGSFSYGDKEVLTDVSLDVTKGEVLCILGANGCGKTTLLRCLNGSLRLNQGRVYIGGRDIHTMSVVDVARYIGFVFQEHSAPFPFSVLEVVRMGRTPYLGFFESPSAKDTLVAEQALDLVGMVHYRDKPYTQISGGERQLVLIARTLAQEPEVVLLDEPTSHLDFKNQTLVLRMINRLAESGMTVIMTSHLPNHALLYSSRVALMNTGSFMAIGSPETIVNEENLKAVYGMDVKILEVAGESTDDTVRFCLPATSSMDVIASGLPGITNVFEGESFPKSGIAQIIFNHFQFSAITRISGRVKVQIPSEGIIISRLPFSSDARKTLKGKVTAIKAQGAAILLEVDIGQRLAVLLTQKSFKELGVSEGIEVFITFRATAVQVAPAG